MFFDNIPVKCYIFSISSTVVLYKTAEKTYMSVNNNDSARIIYQRSNRKKYYLLIFCAIGLFIITGHARLENNNRKGSAKGSAMTYSQRKRRDQRVLQ